MPPLAAVQSQALAAVLSQMLRQFFTLLRTRTMVHEWWRLQALLPRHQLLEPVLRMLQMLHDFWAYAGVGQARTPRLTSERQEFQQMMVTHPPLHLRRQAALRLRLAEHDPGCHWSPWSQAPRPVPLSWKEACDWVPVAFQSTARTSPTPWNIDAIAHNDMAITTILMASASMAFYGFQVESSFLHRTYLDAIQHLHALAACNRCWHYHLRGELQDLHFAFAILERARALLPRVQQADDPWKQLATDMKNI